MPKFIVKTTAVFTLELDAESMDDAKAQARRHVIADHERVQFVQTTRDGEHVPSFDVEISGIAGGSGGSGGVYRGAIVPGVGIVGPGGGGRSGDNCIEVVMVPAGGGRPGRDVRASGPAVGGGGGGGGGYRSR